GDRIRGDRIRGDRIRGDRKGCPCVRFVYYDDAVHVIWHYLMYIHFNIWKTFWQFQPFIVRYYTEIILKSFRRF
ncbi:MAG: hypothetical protein WKF97_26820, partial [Chitinophagaceae bacterium]